jgi:hypothetical protein
VYLSIIDSWAWIFDIEKPCDRLRLEVISQSLRRVGGRGSRREFTYAV